VEGYHDIRQRHVARLMDILPEHVARLRWPADRIRREREDRLRDLLRVAKERSPWHHRHLRDVNPDTVAEADLRPIPPMTTLDLMEHWNEIVADPRLHMEAAEQ